MNKNQLLTNIEAQITDIYGRYAQGQDVSPAQLYRTEGYFEAVCEMTDVDESDILQIMRDQHQNIFKGPLPEEITQRNTSGSEGSPALKNDRRVEIHSAMRRAPVYPST